MIASGATDFKADHANHEIAHYIASTGYRPGINGENGTRDRITPTRGVAGR
jgi:hypothetical protein